jgi:putative SOS response-associated peptidase YedK
VRTLRHFLCAGGDRALFRYGEQPNIPPRYNIAPTQPIPIVRLVDGKQSFAR